MFRTIRRFLAAGLVAAFAAGCVSISELPPEEVKKQGDSPEYALGRAMLIAFLKNDGRAFVSHLEPKVREQFTVQKFRETREQIVRELGEPVSFRFLTTLEMTALKPNVWAVRFERTNPRSEKVFHQEVLFQVVTAFADGKAHVISFNFK